MQSHYNKPLSFHHTIRGKVLIFVGLLAIYATTLFTYSFNQKEILLQKINEIDTLQEAETVLLAADLAVFDAITQLLIILDPTDKDEVLADTHQHFSILTEHYQKLSKLYPERAPSFFALIGSLAKVVMLPNRDDLKNVKVNLERHKKELTGLIRTNQQNRQLLFKSYKNISDKAVNNLILFTLLGLVIMIIISSLFFTKMAADIKRILIHISDIVARKKRPLLKITREDEIGVLIEGINQMAMALDIRDQQLHVDRIDRTYFESIGAIEKLTAGLVHELGNPVAAISGMVAEIEREKDKLPIELQNYVSSIKDYSNKLQLINSDLAKLAAPTSNTYQLLDLNEVIGQTANLLHYDERWYGVDIQLSLAPMLPAIFACDGQLKLLLNSLLTNSLEAKFQNNHVVSIETALAKNEIVLIIKDNGSGMNNKTLEQAFSAFYSTKDPSVHSGMGLFSCLTIVDSHKGRINLSSERRVGTEVRIYFAVPASTEQKMINGNHHEI